MHRHRHLHRRSSRGSTTAGIAWMLPLRHRAGFYRIADHVGFTLRRLLFGRLVGMVFEGIFTWFMLPCRSFRRAVPMAGAARPAHRPARLHSQYRRDHFRRADGRGRVQRRDRTRASGRSSSISSSRTSMAISSCPTSRGARSTLRPALVLGDATAVRRSVRDSRRAARRSDPRDAQGRARGAQPAYAGDDADDEAGGRQAGPAEVAAAAAAAGLLLLAPCCCAACISAASGTTWTTWTSNSRSAVGRDRAAGGGVRAVGQRRRDAGCDSGRPSASASSPRRSRG